MQHPLIVSDPDIMMGKPVIRGTRLTVEHILDQLAGGETVEQLLEEYPRLTREAIQAALAFAADTLRSEVIYPLDQASA
jgi:uncharacterized protein (DUF433 family)